MQLSRISTLCFSLVALGLAGCIFNKEPERNLHRAVVRVPYQFQVAKFTDGRTPPEKLADVVVNREAYPFRREEFLQILVQGMNKGLFVSNPAYLSVNLVDYATVRNDKKYLVTLYADLSAKNATDTLLAEGRYSCLAEGEQTFELSGVIKSVFSERSVGMLDRDSRIWQETLRLCLEDLAYQFNSDISGVKRATMPMKKDIPATEENKGVSSDDME